MVVVSGRLVAPRPLLRGRRTACAICSGGRRAETAPDRLYIAPHAPSLVLPICATQPVAPRSRPNFAKSGSASGATVEVGREMFAGYPAFEPAINSAPVIEQHSVDRGDAGGASPDDRRAVMTRLRFVMKTLRSSSPTRSRPTSSINSATATIARRCDRRRFTNVTIHGDFMKIAQAVASALCVTTTAAWSVATAATRRTPGYSIAIVSPERAKLGLRQHRMRRPPDSTCAAGRHRVWI